ncbi:hypothetical protein TrLO_g13248 [Triparma laevis f. longispina]|uniref:EF-hand domain-containing protein n=1 Tax=Triparma laevis f. longispina TaxID=1714387 RepID=A0A9W7EC20_9STRA|nr:hypothetical protein TrLO_g13248 [Triparma laevis f. longispina]
MSTTAEVQAIFDRYDYDKSGSLSLSELERALKDSKLPAYHAKEVFDVADTNHDGKIDFPEFHNFVAQKEKLLHSTFTQFDKSNTGFINKGDLANVLDEMDLHPTAKDVDILMDILDDDHSGQISYSEFRDHFILLNPVDFSKLADEWMHHSGDAVIGGISNKPADGFHKAASGGISAAISRSVVAPLERLRMQMSVDGAKYNNSNVQALKGMIKEEGVLGLWRGNGVNMIRIIPQNAVAFGIRGPTKKAIEDAFGQSALTTLASNSVSGMICITSVYPLDLVRGRITTSPGVYKGIFDATKKIIGAEGAGALFKGISHANIWAIPYYAATFGAYTQAKQMYVDNFMEGESDRAPGPMAGLVLGMVAGCSGTVSGFPLEAARRKLQMQGVGGRPILYNGLADCLIKVAKNEGLGGLFRGCSANIVKMAPASAITFACYEKILSSLKATF